MELKTLKDLEKNANAKDNIHNWNKKEQKIYENAFLDALSQLKQEAIKWVKEREELGALTAAEWLQFFNIKEEDLK